MKNLEQIRAKNAIEVADKRISGDKGGEVVKKIPAMILQNGFIGALAFAKEQGDDSGYGKVFSGIIKHLADPAIRLHEQKEQSLQAFTEWLCGEDSATLRAVTAEAMAFLAILRRFARKEKGEDYAYSK